VSQRPWTEPTDRLAVRAANPFDIPLIAALHAESFTGMLAGQVWNATAVAEVLAMPGAYGLLAAAHGGEPVGFLLGCNTVKSGDSGDSGEILSLGTARAWRRRGTAKVLLHAAIERAEAAGVSRLFLEVAEDNGAAHELYLGAGFTRIARRPAYYRRTHGPAVDALVLAYDFGEAPAR
jgi:[ribosomal protein S18]-alanine N-acetyltransferase